MRWDADGAVPTTERCSKSCFRPEFSGMVTLRCKEGEAARYLYCVKGPFHKIHIRNQRKTVTSWRDLVGTTWAKPQSPITRHWGNWHCTRGGDNVSSALVLSRTRDLNLVMKHQITQVERLSIKTTGKDSPRSTPAAPGPNPHIHRKTEDVFRLEVTRVMWQLNAIWNPGLEPTSEEDTNGTKGKIPKRSVDQIRVLY